MREIIHTKVPVMPEIDRPSPRLDDDPEPNKERRRELALTDDEETDCET